jgi:hypothetical protein
MPLDAVDLRCSLAATSFVAVDGKSGRGVYSTSVRRFYFTPVCPQRVNDTLFPVFDFSLTGLIVYFK